MVSKIFLWEIFCIVIFVILFAIWCYIFSKKDGLNVKSDLHKSTLVRRNADTITFADKKVKKRAVFESKRINMSGVDHMEGHDFERFCANVLCGVGYVNVVVTPGSNDRGVDIVAVKDGVRWAIQCKRYKSKLGNTAIQEVYAGRVMYDCDKMAVMTNSTFTQGAVDMAYKTGVELWDRSKLIAMIRNSGVIC